MATLVDVVQHCQTRLGLPDFPDFSGAYNGLQIDNAGAVTRIGAAVDASCDSFRRAVAAKVDFLIVHHGLFWDGVRPIVGSQREKLKLALEGNLAVYSAHLPLDAHPELGNNAQLANRLGLRTLRPFFPYQGRDIGLLAQGGLNRSELQDRLRTVFPRVIPLEFGSAAPSVIAIVTGSGASVVPLLREAGVDTLITGELKQHTFTQAQEAGLNLYACGHYATEVFGVQALAADAARQFALPWEFIPAENPL